MQRHLSNKNLNLHYGETFKGLPIMADKGPSFREYLDRLYMTIERTLGEYPRVFAFRCDLRFPVGWQAYTNAEIGNFFESFKAKIAHNRRMVAQQGGRAHSCNVRYVWAREQGEGSQVHHYHLLILLNRDAFFTLGKLESDNANIFHRLEEAWASALGLPVECVRGLVHIPENAEYHIHRDEPLGLEALFYRASYLCKVATKVYGYGHHGFECSRS